MARHWHQGHEVPRPGNFGFPVVTVPQEAGDGGGATRTTVDSKILFGALAASLLLLASGAPLDGPAATMAACVAILFFGLPHGALDLEIINRERGPGRLGMAGLLILYLGLAAAMAMAWRVAPVAALAMFLVIAVVHFAEDWPELHSRFLALGMAIALLAAPAMLHITELEILFEALSGSRDAALVANVLLLLAPTGVAVASVAIWTLWRGGFPNQAMVGALMLAGMILLPPVVGFALFFCLYHSPRHFGMAMSRIAWAPSAHRAVVLLTFASLGVAAALFALEARAELPARVVAASFMTLSLLTVPHMIVPPLADALASRGMGTAPAWLAQWLSAGLGGARSTGVTRCKSRIGQNSRARAPSSPCPPMPVWRAP